MIAVALGSTYLGGEKAKAVLALAVVWVVITLTIPHRPVILLNNQTHQF